MLDGGGFPRPMAAAHPCLVIPTFTHTPCILCLPLRRYIACMNPTAGSFVVDPRLQRLFVTLAVETPGSDSLMQIFGEQVAVCTARLPLCSLAC